jgi:hypothetical protein
MGSQTPVRDQLGTIIGLQPKEETDTVQATLDASMQAVGAMPEVAPPSAPPAKRPLPPPPSLRIEIIAAVVMLVVVIFAFLPGRRSAPAPIALPSPTIPPTTTPTTTPTNIIAINPRAVTLSTAMLYGDYEESTKIGSAPEGLVCTISGQSPDGKWVFLSCPAPTNRVWAEVDDLELTAEQRSVLLDARIVSHATHTVPAFSSPSAPQQQGPSLAFCADRSSIWGKTRQCAATQSAADALADGEIVKINATAEALQSR